MTATVLGWWQHITLFASHATDPTHPIGITVLAATGLAAVVEIVLELTGRNPQ